jgi:hypothetical protein
MFDHNSPAATKNLDFRIKKYSSWAAKYIRIAYVNSVNAYHPELATYRASLDVYQTMTIDSIADACRYAQMAWNMTHPSDEYAAYRRAEAEARIKWHIANNYDHDAHVMNTALIKALNGMTNDSLLELIKDLGKRA